MSAGEVVNYLPNPSFEAPASGWSPVGNTELSLTSEQSLYGLHSLALKNDSGVTGFIEGDLGSPHRVAVTPGSSITFSCSVYAKTIGRPRVTVGMKFYNAALEELGETIVGTGTDAAGIWTRIVASGTVPGTAAKVSVYVLVEETAPGEVHLVDGTQLSFTASSIPYADGSLAGYVWTGEANNSTTAVLIATKVPSSLRHFPSPTEAAPSLEPMQMQYNGLTLGPNTRYGVLKGEGLDMGGSARKGDVPLPRDYGETKGLDLYGGRDIIFNLWLAAGDAIDLSTLQSNLAYATAVQPNEELPLWFKLPGLPVMASVCRPRDRKGLIDYRYTAGAVWEPELHLHATDPRLYGEGRSQEVSAGSLGTGGLTFPAAFPLTFGSTLPTLMEADNEGTIEMRPLAIFTGPLTAPSLENQSIAGEPKIEIAKPGGGEPTIASGDQVLVCFADPRLILYYPGGIESGTEGEDIRDWLTSSSTWWDLPARTTSRIAFRAAAATVGSCELQYASAWML